MICPHCGNAIEQEQSVNLLNAVNVNGANPNPFNLVFNTTTALTSQSLTTWNVNNGANGCNPFPIVTTIKI